MIQNTITNQCPPYPETVTEYSTDVTISPLKYLTHIEAVPHHVLIVYSIYYCSGSLIRSQVVVTAASCFIRRRGQNILVKVGVNTITDEGQIIPVRELKLHEYFNHLKSWKNDIALLALKDHAAFSSKVKKIILVEPETSLNPGTSIGITGWGYANVSNKFKNNLIWTKMTVINKEICHQFYNENLVSTTNYCAIYNKDHELSDNGGGAVHNNILVGILSFGGTSRDEPLIAVYTNVSYFHRWITLNSRRFLEKYCKPKGTDYSHEDKYKENSSMD